MRDLIVQIVVGNLAWDLLKVLLATATIRASLRWLFRRALDRQQEFAFWIIAPALLLAVISIGGSHANQPDLRLEIKRLSITPPPDLPPPQPPPRAGTYLLVTAIVRNVGSPSVAEEWALTVGLGDTQLTAIPIIIAHQLTFKEGDRTIAYPSRVMLYRKTAKPIPTGGRELGLLEFFVDGAELSDIRRAGTTFMLTCNDVWGKKVWTRLTWPVVTSGFYPIPGLEGEDDTRDSWAPASPSVPARP